MYRGHSLVNKEVTAKNLNERKRNETGGLRFRNSATFHSRGSCDGNVSASRFYPTNGSDHPRNNVYEECSFSLILMWYSFKISF
jgi:hypothetical protein